MHQETIWVSHKQISGCSNSLFRYNPHIVFWIIFSIALGMACIPSSSAVLQSSPNSLVNFPGDYYKLDGGPDFIVALDKSTVYQKENTSLFLSLKNRGVINSIKINEEPAANLPEEIYAAKLELDLEHAKTAAQDISVKISMPYSVNESPLELKREVAYAGMLQAGQVSPELSFPVEIYQNTTPGDYVLYATVNYTYQQDVAVKPDSGRPQNPDIYYLYESASQIVPLKLHVERRSGAEFKVLNMTPEALQIGSNENVLKMVIENIGYDTARDLVVRLRPESGIYVSTDESPIPALAPGKKAELFYKIDVSKDAVPGKRYMLKLLFDFSDSFREDLTDTAHTYLLVKSAGYSPLIVVGALALIAVSITLIVVRKRRNSA